MVSAQTWCLETKESLFIYQLVGIYEKSISRHKIKQQSSSRKSKELATAYAQNFLILGSSVQ